MKFKTISRATPRKLDDAIYEFLKNKKLHSIQFSTSTYGDGTTEYSVFIMYEE